MASATRKFFYSVVFLCMAAFADPASADKGGKKGEDSRPSVVKVLEDSSHDSKNMVRLISREDREHLQHFLNRERQEFCPPGLAKKDNGCLPPGIAKKYAVGDRLDDNAALRDLPERIKNILSPRKKGEKYVVVDDEVLLIAEGTKLILDVVRLMNTDQPQGKDR